MKIVKVGTRLDERSFQTTTEEGAQTADVVVKDSLDRLIVAGKIKDLTYRVAGECGNLLNKGHKPRKAQEILFLSFKSNPYQELDRTGTTQLDK